MPGCLTRSCRASGAVNRFDPVALVIHPVEVRNVGADDGARVVHVDTVVGVPRCRVAGDHVGPAAGSDVDAVGCVVAGLVAQDAVGVGAIHQVDATLIAVVVLLRHPVLLDGVAPGVREPDAVPAGVVRLVIADQVLVRVVQADAGYLTADRNRHDAVVVRAVLQENAVGGVVARGAVTDGHPVVAAVAYSDLGIDEVAAEVDRDSVGADDEPVATGALQVRGQADAARDGQPAAHRGAGATGSGREGDRQQRSGYCPYQCLGLHHVPLPGLGAAVHRCGHGRRAVSAACAALTRLA